MKYLNINRRICGAVLAVIVACTGCKKSYLDINDDPNRATDANVTAELIFPQAASTVGTRMASGNLQFLQNWIGYMSPDGDFSLQHDEISYNIDFTFGDVLWQNNYNVLFDLYLTKVKAQAAGDPVLAGASMILSAKLFQDMVDMFGNIPYSQAFQSNQYRLPAYDKAQDVYAALQKSLDSAIIFMKSNPTSTFVKSVDVVNGGKTETWTRFANTLKLRLLIRQSEVSGFNPATEIAKIQANGGVLQPGEDVDVNPGYVNETNKQSPFYANYALTPTGADANTGTRANQYIVGILSNSSDPRINQFFLTPKAGGAITGATYGKATGNVDGAHSSKFGPGLASSASQNQWIFPSFEALFLWAEAQARGWIGGDPQATYESAVQQSFVWLGVPNAVSAANAYLSTQSIAKWSNAGTTALSKAKFIAFQKYIALTAIDPVEAWSDQRRLNILPAGYLSVADDRNGNPLPIRLLYPQSEYTTNGDNVRAQGSDINQFTSKIFWQP